MKKEVLGEIAEKIKALHQLHLEILQLAHGNDVKLCLSLNVEYGCVYIDEGRTWISSEDCTYLGYYDGTSLG